MLGGVINDALGFRKMYLISAIFCGATMPTLYLITFHPAVLGRPLAPAPKETDPGSEASEDLPKADGPADAEAQHCGCL
jgi:hypothetical protein